MSLVNIYPYFRERMDGLDFTEWTDGFSVTNIPQSILDRSYHILVSAVEGGPINHTHQNLVASLTLSVFYKGFSYPVEAIEAAICDIEMIVKDICKVSNRTRDVLNIVFVSSEINPLTTDNDNYLLLALNFEVQVIIDPEN